LLDDASRSVSENITNGSDISVEIKLDKISGKRHSGASSFTVHIPFQLESLVYLRGYIHFEEETYFFCVGSPKKTLNTNHILVTLIGNKSNQGSTHPANLFKCLTSCFHHQLENVSLETEFYFYTAVSNYINNLNSNLNIHYPSKSLVIFESGPEIEIGKYSTSIAYFALFGYLIQYWTSSEIEEWLESTAATNHEGIYRRVANCISNYTKPFFEEMRSASPSTNVTFGLVRWFLSSCMTLVQADASEILPSYASISSNILSVVLLLKAVKKDSLFPCVTEDWGLSNLIINLKNQMKKIENWFLSTHRRCSELPKKTRADILCTALMEVVREEGPESLAVRDLMDCVRMIKEHVNVLVKRVNRYRLPLSWDKDSDAKLRHCEETLQSQMADLENTVAKLCHTSGSQRKRIVSLINENRVGLRGAAGSTSVNFLGGFSSEEAYFVFNRQSVGIEEAAIGEVEDKNTPATAATAVVGTKKNSNFTNSFVGIVVEANCRGNKGKSVSLTKQSNAAVVSLGLKRPQGLTVNGSSGESVPEGPVYVVDSGRGQVRAYFWTGESVDVLDIGSASTAEGQLSTLRDLIRYDYKDVSGKAVRKLIVTDSGRNAVYCVPISNSSSSPSGFEEHDPKKYLSVVGGGRNISRGGGFRSPCGLAVYGDLIVVCDQGNHTLRSIEYVPKVK